MMGFYSPNVILSLANSYDERNVGGLPTAVPTQRKVNVVYEPVRNALTGRTKLLLTKRAGFSESASSLGSDQQVPYLLARAPGALNDAVGDQWLFSVLNNTTRASSIVTTVTVTSAANYTPRYVRDTNLSGVEFLTLQLQDNTTNTLQIGFYSSSIGTWTRIASNFSSLAHAGGMEHMDGYAFIMTKNGRCYQSSTNSLANWGANDFISKNISFDIPMGLMKLKNQILLCGSNSIEPFYNAGRKSGSVLAPIKGGSVNIGLVADILQSPVGSNYYATLGERIYFVGTEGGAKQEASRSLYAYDGARYEKVSTPFIDKILIGTDTPYIHTMALGGQRAIAIMLTDPDDTFVRWLMFFPEWKEWFEWDSKAATAIGSAHFIGTAIAPNKIYTLGLSNVWRDAAAGSSFAYSSFVQFRLPKDDNDKQRMHWCGVVADTTSTSGSSLLVQFSDDDYASFDAGRSIDMTVQSKHITKCGAYRDRIIRLMDFNTSEPMRLDKFVAKVS